MRALFLLIWTIGALAKKMRKSGRETATQAERLAQGPRDLECVSSRHFIQQRRPEKTRNPSFWYPGWGTKSDPRNDRRRNVTLSWPQVPGNGTRLPTRPMKAARAARQCHAGLLKVATSLGNWSALCLTLAQIRVGVGQHGQLALSRTWGRSGLVRGCGVASAGRLPSNSRLGVNLSPEPFLETALRAKME